ncbi:hypothetical protein SISSUDRAFT_405373 [Sistotremastrum suecicum HHB10207 ss-3]|uniref:MYND-type domain-containing protein n=1 Tax=Sistotremastrum suecicum HHB10207 ss-3 TaxID=1314776 RepID=A0A165YRA4_9AGAM|nr:hypothetical protein SISSUDRAFT_405373 [Sistotremastrum suecicum HHB10207 ss-3]
MQSSHHQEMRNAVVDYLQHRKRAAIRWSAIILAVRRVEPSATEGRKLRARQASDSGLLLDKSREDDFLTLNENPKATQILRCTWCGRSSVALKKCSRCEKVGYCNKTWLVPSFH